MRKMNCRMLAAALVAVQIAVTAMPATAFAAENDQIQETVQVVQEQAETPAKEIAPVEEVPAVVAEAPAKEEEAAPVEVEAPAEDSEEEAIETEAQKESTIEVTEETEAAEEIKTPESEPATANAAEVTENKEETKASEKPAQGQVFDQTVTVDRVKIKVTAEEGAFEEGARLIAARVPSTQLKQVENAVADARAKDELVTSAYAFDIKIVNQDRQALQPAADKKVKVSFETEEAADGSLGAVVYHIVGPKNNIKAQKLATTVNRTTKTAEAQTDGLSYYVVEFVSKNSTVANTDTNAPAKTEPTDDTDKTAKTETTEDTKTTGKTDPAPEDKNTKAETVTPAAKDTTKSNTETPAVKKETRTDNKKSEVKKEKKSETKKTETVKKDKANSKKTEKAKTNSKKSPKTGDTSNMVIWITTSLLAVGGIVVLLLFRRRLR